MLKFMPAVLNLIQVLNIAGKKRGAGGGGMFLDVEVCVFCPIPYLLSIVNPIKAGGSESM